MSANFDPKTKKPMFKQCHLMNNPNNYKDKAKAEKGALSDVLGDTVEEYCGTRDGIIRGSQWSCEKEDPTKKEPYFRVCCTLYGYEEIVCKLKDKIITEYKDGDLIKLVFTKFKKDFKKNLTPKQQKRIVDTIKQFTKDVTIHAGKMKKLDPIISDIREMIKDCLVK